MQGTTKILLQQRTFCPSFHLSSTSGNASIVKRHIFQGYTLPRSAQSQWLMKAQVSSTCLLGPVCTDSGSPERPLVTAEAQHRKQPDFSSLTQGLITRYLMIFTVDISLLCKLKSTSELASGKTKGIKRSIIKQLQEQWLHCQWLFTKAK